MQKLELRAIQAERRRKVANLHEKLKLQEFGLKLAMLGQNNQPTGELSDQHTSLVRVPPGVNSGQMPSPVENSKRSNQFERQLNNKYLTPSQAEALRLNQVSAILGDRSGGSLSSRRGTDGNRNPLSERVVDEKRATPDADGGPRLLAAPKLNIREES